MDYAALPRRRRGGKKEYSWMNRAGEYRFKSGIPKKKRRQICRLQAEAFRSYDNTRDTSLERMS
jgi:hypothetical protein